MDLPADRWTDVILPKRANSLSHEPSAAGAPFWICKLSRMRNGLVRRDLPEVGERVSWVVAGPNRAHGCLPQVLRTSHFTAKLLYHQMHQWLSKSQELRGASVFLQSAPKPAYLDGLWSAHWKQQRTEPNIEEHCGLQRFTRRKDGTNEKHGCLRTAFCIPHFSQWSKLSPSITCRVLLGWLVGDLAASCMDAESFTRRRPAKGTETESTSVWRRIALITNVLNVWLLLLLDFVFEAGQF